MRHYYKASMHRVDLLAQLEIPYRQYWRCFSAYIERGGGQFYTPVVSFRVCDTTRRNHRQTVSWAFVNWPLLFRSLGAWANHLFRSITPISFLRWLCAGPAPTETSKKR